MVLEFLGAFDPIAFLVQYGELTGITLVLLVMWVLERRDKLRIVKMYEAKLKEKDEALNASQNSRVSEAQVARDTVINLFKEAKDLFKNGNGGG